MRGSWLNIVSQTGSLLDMLLSALLSGERLIAELAPEIPHREFLIADVLGGVLNRSVSNRNLDATEDTYIFVG